MGGPVHLTLRAGLSVEPRDLTGIVASVIGLLRERHRRGHPHVSEQVVGWDKTIESGTIRLRQTRQTAERIGADARCKVSDRVKERFAEARP